MCSNTLPPFKYCTYNWRSSDNFGLLLDNILRSLYRLCGLLCNNRLRLCNIDLNGLSFGGFYCSDLFSHSLCQRISIRVELYSFQLLSSRLS